ncbi:MULTISPECIES: hypothetical protein [Microbacterium]|uniref:DUF4177 domain-containing protein n=1 Tax=Microbacterium resistens TaxID=156977 RepID=A0ABY3RUW9_9MICO|nr:hypothetical protein [Microbacterium resistens]MBW1639113.1 hypothetical protein [Microbacterium resistens]MDA4893614.1 hypothetical protein [Streptomyces sp. MS2A]UGS27849.1 hypothetical protein K8F61_06700 [Microbacterium resistens]
MLIGLIRPVETRTATVQGHELDEIQDLLAAQTPEGWELASAPVTMAKKDTVLTAEGLIVRRDGLQEIEAEDLAALEAKVPAGHMLISVREA